MRITKAELIEHIRAGRVFLAPNTQYLLKIATGPDRGTHRIADDRINRLGDMVNIEGDSSTVGGRRLSIRTKGETGAATYTMTTTVEGRNGVHTETATRLAEGDVEALRQAAKWVAEPGDTISHQVAEER